MAKKYRPKVRVGFTKAWNEAVEGKSNEVKLHPAISHLNATSEFVQSKENVQMLNNLVEEVLKKEDESFFNKPCRTTGCVYNAIDTCKCRGVGNQCKSHT